MAAIRVKISALRRIMLPYLSSVAKAQRPSCSPIILHFNSLHVELNCDIHDNAPYFGTKNAKNQTGIFMQKPRRVAIMLDLDWPFKRHVSTFAGTQQYGQEHGWHSIMDEFVDEKLSVNSPLSVPYDGIIARASKKLAVRAARLKIPLVNVWRSSPAWRSVPGVFPDYAAAGCLRAEHLLSR